MEFISITIDQYVKQHLENNPKAIEADVRKKLEEALGDFYNGMLCGCGNEIWVIGSAFMGKGCYSCITGQNYPDGNLELDVVINRPYATVERRRVDTMEPSQLCGGFNYSDYEINPETIKIPAICLNCAKFKNKYEELLCNLNRLDQMNDDEFVCFAYRKNK